MALHGDVRINGERLYAWSARRLSWMPEAENEYEVEVYAPDGEGLAVTRLTHVYDDGALALAAKALAWASAEVTP